MARYIIQPVNPFLQETVLTYVSEIEELHFELVGREGYQGSTFVFECAEEDPYKAVPVLSSIVGRPPLRGFMFCRVAPYGVAVWPPAKH
jgi:hypothetical protein